MYVASALLSPGTWIAVATAVAVVQVEPSLLTWTLTVLQFGAPPTGRA